MTCIISGQSSSLFLFFSFIFDPQKHHNHRKILSHLQFITASEFVRYLTRVGLITNSDALCTNYHVRLDYNLQVPPNMETLSIVKTEDMIAKQLEYAGRVAMFTALGSRFCFAIRSICILPSFFFFFCFVLSSTWFENFFKKRYVPSRKMCKSFCLKS
jgi:hypothetical protein